jgi:CubicO group peptidase (beta-lactamase class C family)
MNSQTETTIFPVPQFADPKRREKLATAFPQMEPLFREFVEQRRIPGLAYGIVVDGELAYSGGLGLRNIAGNAPATPDSVFRIASMTKSFTAMCILKLRDEGKLRLDSPAADYVPELAALRYPTRDSVPITIRQLLTMSAGFPQDDPWADRQLAQADTLVAEWLRGGISFSNPPGMTFEYSNYGYSILGRVVTNVAGMPYQAYVASSILKPLNMTSSTFDVHHVPADRLAMGYRLEADGWVEDPPLLDGAFAPMGGLFTTITDFARYMAFLLSAFPPRDDEESGPIRRSSAREMQHIGRAWGAAATRQTPDAPLVVQSGGYGYGLSCATDSILGYIVSHGGGLPGYATFYRLLPECGVGVVAFSNLTYVPVGIKVTEALGAFHKTGGLTARSLPVSSALLTARSKIDDLYNQWSDDAVRALATETFFLDMPIEKRREQLERLRTDMGMCLSLTDIQPENALRGRWMMQCEQGRVEVFVTLAPTVPPRVQVLEFTAAKPLNAQMRQAVRRLMRLIRAWDNTEFRALCAPPIKRGQIRPQLEALHTHYGPFQIGDVLEGDGQTQARVRLISKLGMLNVRLVLDPRSGKLTEVAFSKPREVAIML